MEHYVFVVEALMARWKSINMGRVVDRGNPKSSREEEMGGGMRAHRDLASYS